MVTQRKYRLQYLESALEDLKLVKKNLGVEPAQSILKTIEQLSYDPFPSDSEPFWGLDIEDCYKLRNDKQIIVYSVDEPILLILIVAVKDAKGIYDDLLSNG